MDDMDLDFWGITRHYKVEPDPYGVNRYGYMPGHIQSHFMTLRKDFINSKDYRDFITNLKILRHILSRYANMRLYLRNILKIWVINGIRMLIRQNIKNIVIVLLCFILRI